MQFLMFQSTANLMVQKKNLKKTSHVDLVFFFYFFLYPLTQHFFQKNNNINSQSIPNVRSRSGSLFRNRLSICKIVYVEFPNVPFPPLPHPAVGNFANHSATYTVLDCINVSAHTKTHTKRQKTHTKHTHTHNTHTQNTHQTHTKHTQIKSKKNCGSMYKVEETRRQCWYI